MIFIDGCHEFLSIMRDIKIWLPKTKKIICGHDYDGDVIIATQYIFGSKVKNIIDGIWMVEL